MYGQHPVDDLTRFAKAMVTDQIAWLAPRIYVRLTKQTGRGSEEESPRDIAEYFKKCFCEYFQRLQIEPESVSGFLSGKQVLEYGPGDVPALALLMVAHGAASVVCVDRFPLVSLSAKNIEVMNCLMQELEGEAKARAESCFVAPGDPAAGLAGNRIRYLVHASGLSGLSESIDLIVSRAVLEHVNDLDATFADMRRALRPDGTAIHLVDLKSHGLHRRNPLDFLTWPAGLWTLMYGHKGVPNRLRVDSYRSALHNNGLEPLVMEPIVTASEADLKEVRPHLAKPFRGISDADLCWLEFWLVVRRKDNMNLQTQGGHKR